MSILSRSSSVYHASPPFHFPSIKIDGVLARWTKDRFFFIIPRIITIRSMWINGWIKSWINIYKFECCGATCALRPWRGSSVDSSGVYSRLPLLSLLHWVICVWTVANFSAMWRQNEWRLAWCRTCARAEKWVRAWISTGKLVERLETRRKSTWKCRQRDRTGAHCYPLLSRFSIRRCVDRLRIQILEKYYNSCFVYFKWPRRGETRETRSNHDIG